MRSSNGEKSRAMGGVCTLVMRFLKEWRQLAARFWMANDVWTHIGVDVQRHAGSPRVCSLAYDVSEKHFETNLHLIWAGVNLSTRVMGAWQVGHRHVEGDEIVSGEGESGAIASNRRQSSNEEERW